jgi:hypothetical protein
LNRRGLGRGRLLASVGALLVLVSIPLTWWQVGGSPGIAERSGNGLSGAGIIIILAAVFLLALVVLPYAGRDRPQPLDRPISFIVVAALAVVGLAAVVLQIYDGGGLGALGLPDRSPGLWLAVIGVAAMAWGTSEILSEPSRR